ncbi:MAG: hypothetical protein H6R13_284 [Proteobacteria bacterium]|nr:hypothetical protein [Pseudomonadota bacterium]
MQHNVGQPGNAQQAAPVIEIGQQRYHTGGTPLGSPGSIAQQCIDAGAMGKAGEDAAGNVPAADNQDFLHGCIVADQ